MKRKTGMHLRMLAACLAALVLSAGLGGMLSPRAGAAEYSVTLLDGGEGQANDADKTTVYPVSALADSGWTIADVTVNGDTYKDADGNFYSPAHVSTTVILARTSIWLPTAYINVVSSTGAGSVSQVELPTYTGGATQMVCAPVDVPTGGITLSVTSEFKEADAAPVDGAATVTEDGVQTTYVLCGGYYRARNDGTVIQLSFTSSPYFTVTRLYDETSTPTNTYWALKRAEGVDTSAESFRLTLNTASYQFPSSGDELSKLVTSYKINDTELLTQDSGIEFGDNQLFISVPGAYMENGDITITITLDTSLITPINSGGNDSGGGGDSEPAQTEIRVENELDQPDIRSDTTLWPVGTIESGGISTTVISDAELQALLDLAAKHAADTRNLDGSGLKEGIICIEDKSAASKNSDYILSLKDTQFEKLAQADWDRLTMQTPAGSFSLYPGTIQQAAELAGAGSGVQLELERTDDEGRPGLNATLRVDSSEVTVLDETYGVRLFVPYTPAADEDVNALVIEYIHADGTKELVTECSYDKDLGGIVFFTCHLSKFGVTYRPATFSDVGPKQWANPYVTFLVSRGVLKGTSGSAFHPDAAATRGAFLAVLTRALSAAKLPSEPVQTYSDVAANSYIGKAANWLYFNNLAKEITSASTLRPEAAITREEAALLVNNAARGMGLRVRSRGLDTAYTDGGQIADYAKQAVTRLRAAGILEMPQNQKFNPKATLNRGEMAQLIATLLGGL
jgi:S-layer homology domain.